MHLYELAEQQGKVSVEQNVHMMLVYCASLKYPTVLMYAEMVTKGKMLSSPKGRRLARQTSW